jgi:prenylcysteine alpha-carboxyl methylesterase
VIFVTGGMWIIGYKAWGALLAQRLARRGVIVASLDYRNFPQGTVGDMIADVGNGIGWVLERLEALGGDKRRVVIVGQSAGAHISATALLRQTEWTSPRRARGRLQRFRNS